MKGEDIDLTEFKVGGLYSREDVANKGRVEPPTGGWGGTWGSGIVRFDNAFVLFVTLEKTTYTYHDTFEGRRFWWQSQSRQRRTSKDLSAIEAGQKSTHLFVRVREKDKSKKQAEPFVYCGRLRLMNTTGDKPVTCEFSVIDYVESPNPELAEIYGWRAEGETISSEEILRRQAIRSMRLSPAPSLGQGYIADTKKKLAIERHAMSLAIGHYKDLGFSVEDTSATHPFDLVCRRGFLELRIEVKGTQGLGKTINVTSGEVDSARSHATELIVVHSISIERSSLEPTATGGTLVKYAPWIPEDDLLTAKSFKYAVPDISSD